MSAALILSTIKYASFGITAASTIWGLTKETTSKDSAGKKVLTRSGMVAIVFTLGSALLGTLSFALETFIKEQAAVTERTRSEEVARQAKLEAQLREQKEEARIAHLGTEQRSIANEAELNSQLREQRATLTQLAVTQRLLLASQPLRTLQFKIVLASLPSSAIAIATEGQQRIEYFNKGNADELREVPPAADRDLQRALMAKHVLYPVLLNLVGLNRNEGENFKEQLSGDIALLIDIDGTGEILLPIGVTQSERSRGYFDTYSSLKTETSIYPEPQELEGIPRPLFCERFNIRVFAKRRSLEISGSLSAECLNSALHKREGSVVTATLSTQPRVILIRGANDGLFVKPDNATSRNDKGTLCWQEHQKATRPISLTVALTPNGQLSLATQSTGVSSLSQSLTVNGQQGPLFYYGRCLAAIPVGA